MQGDPAVNNSNFTQTEINLYGSARLGVMNTNIDCSNLALPEITNFTRGVKLFELTNHLGNVLSTVTDRLDPIPTAAGNIVDYYQADVLSASDYYPGGMQMPGRSYSSASYRYGFNGKENDNDVKGSGNQQDYGMRIYDPRLGRFLSVDPITKDYPWYTPYQFAGNSPIQAIDVDGLEPATPAPPLKLQQPVLTVPYEDDPKSWTHKADGWQVNNQFGLALLTNAGYYAWDFFGGRSIERFVRNRQDPGKNNVGDITADLAEVTLATVEVKGTHVELPAGRFKDIPTASGTGRHELIARKALESTTEISQKDNTAIRLPNPLHYQTKSFGIQGVKFRAEQAKLLEAGKFQEAFDMGVNDLRSAYKANTKLFEGFGITKEALDNAINVATESFKKDLLPALEKQYKEAQKAKSNSSTSSSRGG